MFSDRWNDLTPSKRCDWIDQLRGWAVIVMIEVHVVNVWLHKGLIPGWLNFLNGLVAPSFIMCAGYSLVLSTFRPDGTLRPFAPTAKRLGFILLCAYALHAPGFTAAEWTVLSTPQKFSELFKIDVLQCIVFSLLILQGLARIIRRPMVYAAVALVLALGATWAAPHLWRQGVADGWWLPIRGLINGNTDRGVTALFPLFPWIAFAAFGSVLGALYRHFRVMPTEGKARWSESRWLVSLSLLGVALLVWGSLYAREWLWNGTFPASDAWRLHNTTLPSVAQRLGVVCVAGALMGWVEMVRSRWVGPNLVEAASRESLLLYMLHLNLIFGLLLVEPIRVRTGWDWYSMGWPGTLTLTVLIIAVNLAAGVAWQRIREKGNLALKIQKSALVALGVWFVVGGWMTYFHFRKSPELAREPYPFLNAARVRKGLPPTEDGLSHDPLEVAQEKARRRLKLSDEDRRMLNSTP
ncbi:MAG: heparan-alpha-glucosaminide N-acetyltransferase domain-containing protein [Holophaga sp.]